MLKEESWSLKDELWKKVWKLLGLQRKTLLAQFVNMHQRISYMSSGTAHWLKKFGNRSTQIPVVGKLAGRASSDYWLGAYGRIVTSSFFKENRVAAAGEVLRDKNGERILGYNKYLVKAIHGSVLNTSHSALIRRIHRILSQESSWLLCYIPRKQNQSVDFIAKLAFGKKEDLQLIETPSEAVLALIRVDKKKNLCILFSNPIT
ncbi:hypothetical protein Gotur_028953 [Gossypium turneri]